MKLLFKLTLLILLTSCSNAVGNEDPNTITDWEMKISEFEETISDKELKLNEANHTIRVLEQEIAAFQQIKNKHTQVNEILEKITSLDHFHYEILKQEDEIIVFVDDVPMDHHLRQIYLYRSAIEFSTYHNKIIHVWDDKQIAEQYISGDYDRDETVLGWSGLDRMFGTINNIENELIYRFSRDDLLSLEFGKYLLRE